MLSLKLSRWDAKELRKLSRAFELTEDIDISETGGLLSSGSEIFGLGDTDDLSSWQRPPTSAAASLALVGAEASLADALDDTLRLLVSVSMSMGPI